VRSLFKWVPKSSELAIAEQLEQRADEGRVQMFDSVVNDSVERMGMRPIVDTEGESVEREREPESSVAYDTETGEVREPGQEG
jgi:hypothetical protein